MGDFLILDDEKDLPNVRIFGNTRLSIPPVKVKRIKIPVEIKLKPYRIHAEEITSYHSDSGYIYVRRSRKKDKRLRKLLKRNIKTNIIETLGDKVDNPNMNETLEKISFDNFPSDEDRNRWSDGYYSDPNDYGESSDSHIFSD